MMVTVCVISISEANLFPINHQGFVWIPNYDNGKYWLPLDSEAFLISKGIPFSIEDVLLQSIEITNI